MKWDKNFLGGSAVYFTQFQEEKACSCVLPAGVIYGNERARMLEVRRVKL